MAHETMRRMACMACDGSRVLRYWGVIMLRYVEALRLRLILVNSSLGVKKFIFELRREDCVNSGIRDGDAAAATAVW